MKAIRIGVCALVAFAVVAHGVVEPWSETVFELGAALLFVTWGVLFVAGAATKVRWNWLLAPVAALLAFAVVQYVTKSTAVGFLTQIEILKLSALLVLMFLSVQAYESQEQWRGFVWFLLVFGFVVSVQGILQHFTFNGKLYWFRELRYGGIPFGPYVNRNHFAGLVELIVPSGLSVLLLRSEQRDRMPLLTLLTLLPIGALFLSASRGGIVGFLLEVGLVVILGTLWGRGRNQLAAGAVVLVLAMGLVGWLGVGEALDRFAVYRKLEITDSSRIDMAKGSLRIFADHPLGGAGLGTLPEVFPRYQTVYDGTVVNHSHNDYAEALAETGLIGGICCAAFLWLFFREGLRRLKTGKGPVDLALHIGAFAACCALLMHSLVDFNLHMPSNALLFLLLTVLATSPTPSVGPFLSGTPRKHS
jgi:O-antigen ligase